jgi:hypothetical protein
MLGADLRTICLFGVLLLKKGSKNCIIDSIKLLPLLKCVKLCTDWIRS